MRAPPNLNNSRNVMKSCSSRLGSLRASHKAIAPQNIVNDSITPIMLRITLGYCTCASPIKLSLIEKSQVLSGQTRALLDQNWPRNPCLPVSLEAHALRAFASRKLGSGLVLLRTPRLQKAHPSDRATTFLDQEVVALPVSCKSPAELFLTPPENLPPPATPSPFFDPSHA